MARHSDPQNHTDTAATTTAVDRFLASAPSAPRAVDRRADVRGAMLGGRPIRAGDVAVRDAREDDAPVLARLAERDAGRVPGAPILIAERAGVPVAAIGVLDRRVLADPAPGTHVAVDRLQAVAAELRGPERRRRLVARVRGARRGASAGASRDGIPGAAR